MRLKEISGLTLEHCNRIAEDFREGTRDHDVGQAAGWETGGLLVLAGE